MIKKIMSSGTALYLPAPAPAPAPAPRATEDTPRAKLLAQQTQAYNSFQATPSRQGKIDFMVATFELMKLDGLVDEKLEALFKKAILPKATPQDLEAYSSAGLAMTQKTSSSTRTGLAPAQTSPPDSTQEEFKELARWATKGSSSSDRSSSGETKRELTKTEKMVVSNFNIFSSILDLSSLKDCLDSYLRIDPTSKEAKSKALGLFNNKFLSAPASQASKSSPHRKNIFTQLWDALFHRHSKVTPSPDEPFLY